MSFTSLQPRCNKRLRTSGKTAWPLKMGPIFCSETSSSPIGTIAHCGLWPVEQCPSHFSLSATNSLHLLTPSTWRSLFTPLSIFSYVFPFFLFLPVREWRSFWASYPPPIRSETSLNKYQHTLSTVPEDGRFLAFCLLIILGFVVRICLKCLNVVIIRITTAGQLLQLAPI